MRKMRDMHCKRSEAPALDISSLSLLSLGIEFGIEIVSKVQK